MDIQTEGNLTGESKIPIRNFYYLLCYAWDRLEEGALIDVSGVNSDVPVDLLASILIKALRHILRRGIRTEYIAESDALSAVRGRVRILETERRFLRQNCRVFCDFDEFTPDTPANQIIKGTLRLLSSDPDLNPTLAHDLKGLIKQLSAVKDVRINPQSFRSLNIDRNNSFYRFLLGICRFAQSAQMPAAPIGQYRFRDFFRDEAKMALLFQFFVFNFLRRERKELQVFREHISWKVDELSSGNRGLLPTMDTDISVRCGTIHTIIDTKFYRQPLPKNQFGTKKFYSSHLYQLYSYLQNATSDDTPARGILLYAQVGRGFKESFSLRGSCLTLMTLDLSAAWQDIRSSLMSLQFT